MQRQREGGRGEGGREGGGADEMRGEGVHIFVFPFFSCGGTEGLEEEVCLFIPLTRFGALSPPTLCRRRS